MTREALGLVALNAVFVTVGIALLAAIGVVESRAAAVRFSGLALVTGWAALGIATSFGLILGFNLSVAQVLALAVVLVAAAAPAVRRAAAFRQPARTFARSRLETVVAWAGAVVLVVYLEALLLRASLAEPARWDTWAFWTPKAMSIVYFKGLDTSAGGFTSFANPDYPPLKPALDAIVFRFVGEVDPGALPLQDWIMVVGFFGAAAALLAGRVRPWVLWPSLAVLVLLPDFGLLVGSVLADEPLALLFALAGLGGALWLMEREAPFAMLAALFLAAGALMKNEGLMLALVLSVVLAVVARGRNWRQLIPVAVLPVLAVVPWRIWMHANGVPEPSTIRLADLTAVDLLFERADRLAVALAEMARTVLAFDRWFLTVPLVLVVAVVLTRRRPELAAYTVGTLALGFLGFAVVYWASPYPLDWYLSTTVERVLASLVVFGATLFPLLVSEALGPVRAEAPGDG